MERNNKSKRSCAIAVLSALFLANTASAHHSLAGEFDSSVNVELRRAIRACNQ